MVEGIAHRRIAEIHDGMRDLDVLARVVDVCPTREVTTRYGKSTLAVAKIADESGTTFLNLWREQVEKVKVGPTRGTWN